MKINITKMTGMKNGARERNRELIRIRDNHTCQICGKKWQEGTRRFDIHHKDCKKEKTKQVDNLKTEQDNMITVCHKCHMNLPGHGMKKRSSPVDRHFFTPKILMFIHLTDFDSCGILTS